MAQSLFISLKTKHPQAIIDVLAPDWSRPILQRMPEVNRAIVMPIGHGAINLLARREIGRSLKSANYDQAIILPNSLKSAIIPCFAGIPKRTGWRGEMRYALLNDIRLLNKNRYPLMVQRFVALAYQPMATLPEKLPTPHLAVDQTNVLDALTRFELNSERPILALCPGAEFGEAKRWPANHYAEVAQHKINDGWQVWLFGSAKDAVVTDQIQSRLSPESAQYCLNLAGETSLGDAVDLMSLASAVVTNDSGLMHIAAALDRPLVVLYGSSSPAFTPPLSKQVKILKTSIECSPCFKRECPLGHLKCLKELPVDWVLQGLNELVTPPSITCE